jgi:hypothetical protein
MTKRRSRSGLSEKTVLFVEQELYRTRTIIDVATEGAARSRADGVEEGRGCR